MAQIRAVVANSAYLEATDDGKARQSAIEQINSSFDEQRARIEDPEGLAEKEAVEKLMEIPVYAAGIRAFENMKWDMEAGINPLDR